jgi:hypothetical protein
MPLDRIVATRSAWCGLKKAFGMSACSKEWLYLSDYHRSDCEDCCFLGCKDMYSRRNWRRFRGVAASETSVNYYETTQRNIAEDSRLLSSIVVIVSLLLQCQCARKRQHLAKSYCKPCWSSSRCFVCTGSFCSCPQVQFWATPSSRSGCCFSFCVTTIDPISLLLKVTSFDLPSCCALLWMLFRSLIMPLVS